MVVDESAALRRAVPRCFGEIISDQAHDLENKRERGRCECARSTQANWLCYKSHMKI